MRSPQSVAQSRLQIYHRDPYVFRRHPRRGKVSSAKFTGQNPVGPSTSGTSVATTSATLKPSNKSSADISKTSASIAAKVFFYLFMEREIGKVGGGRGLKSVYLWVSLVDGLLVNSIVINHIFFRQ